MIRISASEALLMSQSLSKGVQTPFPEISVLTNLEFSASNLLRGFWLPRCRTNGGLSRHYEVKGHDNGTPVSHDIPDEELIPRIITRDH